MRYLLGLVAGLILVGVASAEIKITGETKVAPHRLVKLEATGAQPKAGLIWRVSPSKAVDKASTAKGHLQFTAPPGEYAVTLLAVRLSAAGETEVEEAEATVVIGEPKPPEPGPGPGPKPPDPPKPGDTPIPGPGLKVLIIYESAELSKMPATQQSILFARQLRDHLQAKCVVGPDNKTKEWRIYDKDVDTSAESKRWQDAMKRPRKSVPWIVIGGEASGYEGPLPATVSETLELLKKYESVTMKKAG